MAKVSPYLAKTLLLSLELLKAFDEEDHEYIYELKKKIKIYKEKATNYQGVSEQFFFMQQMKEYVLENLIDRQKNWIEEFWEQFGVTAKKNAP